MLLHVFRLSIPTWRLYVKVVFYYIFTAIDPYVKIICEGEKVVSERLIKTNCPEWNIKATFYRKKPDMEPIMVEVSMSDCFNSIIDHNSYVTVLSLHIFLTLLLYIYTYFLRYCLISTHISYVTVLSVHIFLTVLCYQYTYFLRYCVINTHISYVSVLYIYIFLTLLCYLYTYFLRYCVISTHIPYFYTCAIFACFNEAPLSQIVIKSFRINEFSE